MDQHSAFVLISETLRSSDPQARRNSLTALASIPADESLREIVRTALTDSDVSVRDRAEDEIMFLANTNSASVHAVLAEFLHSPSQLTCYGLIGRLRGRGAPVQLPRLRLAAKIKYAIATRRVPAERLSARAAMGPACLGSLIALISLLLYINLSMKVNLGSEGTTGLVLAALILPFCVALFTKRWWQPIQLQADRITATITDCLLFCFVGTSIAGIVLCSYLIDIGSWTSVTSVAVVLLAGAASLASTRIGSIIGHGCLPGSLGSRISQILTGVATGALILTIVTVGIGAKEDGPTAVIWVVLLPILFGISCLIARIDGSGPAKHRPRVLLGAISRPLSVVLVACAAACSVLPFLPARPTEAQLRTSQTGLTVNGSGETGPQEVTIPVATLPFTMPLALKAHAFVKATVQASPSQDITLQIGLWRGLPPKTSSKNSGPTLSESSALDFVKTSPPVLEELLIPSRYYIGVIGSESNVWTGSKLELPNTLPYLATRARSRVRPLEVFALTVTLNGFSDSEMAKKVNEIAGDIVADSGAVAEAASRAGTDSFPQSKIKAIAYFNRAISANPKYAEAYLLRAATFRSLNDWNSALRDANSYVGLKPSDSKGLESRAYYHEELHQFEPALDDVAKALKLDSQSASAWNREGNIYLDLNRDELARTDYSKAIQIAPENGYYYANRAFANLALGDKNAALADADKAISVASNSAIGYEARAEVDDSLGRYSDALKELSKVLEIDPSDGDAFCDRADTYAHIGEYSAAEQDVNDLVAINPKSSCAYSVLAYIRNLGGRYSEGLKNANIALELLPDRPGALKNRGRSYSGLKKYDLAIQDLRKAVSLLPNFPEAYQYLGDAEAAQGDRQAAAEDWNKAKQQGYHPPATSKTQ